ncbi:MAG TPA: hypothetical protein VHR86_07030, partial [Armatimonadota bacterium]|nr:hypothetical protein [Armatimonadota bacterium]
DPNWDEWPGIFNKLHAARVPGSPYLQKYPELSQYADTHPEAMTGVKFLRNIVYYTSEGTAWLRGEQKESWGDGNQLLYQLSMRQEDFSRNEWDYNTIYCPKDLSLRVNLGLSPMPRQMLSWEDWQKQGGDKHSILADPLFVDVAKNDYRLRPESPALKQGFKQIPVEKIGPFADPRRASWPIQETPGVSALGDLVTERFVELPEYAPTPASAFAARAGLGNFFAKLAAKQPVKFAYFGGGIAPQEGWRAGILQWLRGRYPGVTIEDVDAGINDCVRGSGFSVYRFAHDVLAKKPDLVLVDFASDDFQTDPQAIWGAIEGVVRQARKADPALEICFLYSFREGFEQDYAQGKSPITVSAYEKLAAHYGIPSINMGYRVAALAREGKLLLKADAPEAGKMLFSREGVRPLADGNRIYVEAITEALAMLAQYATPAARTLPPAFFAGNLENAKQVAITKAMLQGEWQQLPADDPLVKSCAPQFDNLWVTTKPGAKLSFKFRGTAVSLFDLMGPDTGQAIVTVDGKQQGVRSQVDPWCTYQRLTSLYLADNLPDGEHTVTVELHPDAPDRRVVLDAARKQPGFKPELYQGVALRLAWIRVVGDVIE